MGEEDQRKKYINRQYFMQNRTFKFRVWDSDYKSFRYFNLGDNSKDIFWMYNNIENYLDNIQQYIGLNDKFGKEIYEGDIVKFRYEMYEHDWEDDLGEVFFEKGMFLFGRNVQLTTSDYNFDEQSIEIIGNILENPDFKL